MTGFARGLQDASLVTVENFLFMLNTGPTKIEAIGSLNKK